MKDTRGCGKCGSRRIVEVIGSSMNQMTKIPLTKWSMQQAILDRYICLHCGYTEEYVQLTPSLLKWGKKQIEKNGGEFDEYV